MASKKKKMTTKSATPTPDVLTKIFEAQYSQDQVATYQRRITELAGENDQLKLKQTKSERSTHEFVAYFQHELEQKQDMVQNLTEQLAAEKKALEYQRTTVQSNWTVELETITKEKLEMERTLGLQLANAEEDLVKLQHFRDVKMDLESQLHTMSGQYTASKEEFEDKYAALERKLLEDRAKSQKEIERRIEKIRHESRQEARDGLDADTRKILADNQQMAEELHFQLQMTNELELEMELLLKKNKDLRLEVELSNEKDRHVAKKGQRQNYELSQLRAKTKTLEQNAKVITRDFENEKKQIQSVTQRELENQTLDCEGLRRLLKVKNKELKTMKQLAQTILDQRSDVEHFFLESLEQVKYEIQQEKELDLARQKEEYRTSLRDGNIVEYSRQHPQKHTLSSMRSTCRKKQFAQQLQQKERKSRVIDAPEKQPPSSSSDKVDLRDLSWEDRERVLRLLFARINNAQDLLAPTSSEDLAASKASVFITTSQEEHCMT